MEGIDTSFDFRSDAVGGDPDSKSPTLRRYHLMLWSKALPGGGELLLDDQTPGFYLHYRQDGRDFSLASDSVIASFGGYLSMEHILNRVPQEEQEEFEAIGYTIGAMMVFPGDRVHGMQTINGARGFHPRIADRMDLTLECIRRYYAATADPDMVQPSPLGAALARYAGFFGLFGGFDGYVDFFLLQDLIDADGSVRFFMPFDDFSTPAKPRNLEEYTEFRRRSIEFVQARNRRIDAIDE